MRLTLVLALLAVATIFGSIQMLPYPPKPTIKMHTFITKKVTVIVDRTHKGDRLPIATHAAALRGTILPADANAMPATRSPSGYYGPHCSGLANCNFKSI